eukprot:g12995.t1
MAAAAEEVAHIAAIAEKNARKCDPICADDLEPLEPHLGFAAAHSAAGKIHELLENLKAAKQKNTDEALSFDSCSNSLQKQLLSLRRAHRAMIKFSDARLQTFLESGQRSFQLLGLAAAVRRPALWDLGGLFGARLRFSHSGAQKGQRGDPPMEPGSSRPPAAEGSGDLRSQWMHQKQRDDGAPSAFEDS